MTGLSPEVRRLVVAARRVADLGNGSDETYELLDAVEPFAERIPYDHDVCAAPGCTNITGQGICTTCQRWTDLEATRLSRASEDTDTPPPRFVQPTPAEMSLAARIVDSHPVISAYAATEWHELYDDGKVWVAAIVREAMRQPQLVSAELHAQIGEFIVHMAKHYRRRTSRRLCGIRMNTIGRQQAMELAYATYGASLDVLGVPFGDPSLPWDRDAAHALVDDDLQHWEA